MITNVVIAGLGGQGVIKASDIVAAAALTAGFDVKKSEIHGMSQRGGSVTSDVRFGAKVLSPMVPAGEADFLVVVAPDQVENNCPLLRPDGVLLQPATLGEVTLPNPRTLNVALIGVLSALLTIDEASWRAALEAHLPPKMRTANEAAFAAGRAVGERIASTRPVGATPGS